jgi:hypothetical protein
MRVSALVFSSIITAAIAADIKVNYFSDGGCQDYILTIEPSTDWSCYDYEWSAQNSVGVASSSFPNGTPVCIYYTGAHCTGASQTKSGVRNNCASNYGHGFLSMSCGIEHGFKQ